MQQTNNKNKHPDGVGAVWIRESSSGADYLSIKIETSKLAELMKDDNEVINIKGFLNGAKLDDNDSKPTFILFPSKKSKKEEINGNK